MKRQLLLTLHFLGEPWQVLGAAQTQEESQSASMAHMGCTAGAGVSASCILCLLAVSRKCPAAGGWVVSYAHRTRHTHLAESISVANGALAVRVTNALALCCAALD